MAGAVLVDVTGGNVKITGDDQENDIAVFVDQNVLHIESGPNATAINIKPGDVLPAGDAIGKITIDMKKALIPVGNPPDPRGALGVDTVRIHDIDVGNALSITGKNGGVVEFDSVIARKTTINFSAGNGLRDATNGCLVDIDQSDLGFNGGPSSHLPGGVTIATKDCRDHVLIANTSLQGNVSIKTNGDNDDIGLFNLQGFGFFSIGNLTIDSGKGDDLVAASGVDVNGKTSIKLGDGVDQLLIGGADINSFEGTVSVDAGKGNDTIGVGNTVNAGGNTTTFGSKITLKAGTEDDKLMIGFLVNVQDLKHSIDGGKQTNADTLESTIDPNLPIFKNWENRGGFVQQNLVDLQDEAINRFF